MNKVLERNCPVCNNNLQLTSTGSIICVVCDDDLHNLMGERWREGLRFKCPICGVANDPNMYAMKKVGGRWYHTICLDKAIWFFLDRFDFRLGENLKMISCKEKIK